MRPPVVVTSENGAAVYFTPIHLRDALLFWMKMHTAYAGLRLDDPAWQLGFDILGRPYLSRVAQLDEHFPTKEVENAGSSPVTTTI